MTIAATHKVTNNFTADTGTYVMNSYSPGASGLQVLIAIYRRGTNNFGLINSVTGPSITSSVRVATNGFASNNIMRVELWSAVSTASNGVVTIACPDTNIMCLAHLCEFTGVNTGGTFNGVVQSATSKTLGTAQSVTLAAFSGPSNASYAMMAGGGLNGTTGITRTVEASWTKLAESSVSDATGAGDMTTMFLNNPDTSPSMTASGSENWAAIAVELDNSVFVTSKANPVHVHSQAVPRASRW